MGTKLYQTILQLHEFSARANRLHTQLVGPTTCYFFSGVFYLHPNPFPGVHCWCAGITTPSAMTEANTGISCENSTAYLVNFCFVQFSELCFFISWFRSKAQQWINFTGILRVVAKPAGNLYSPLRKTLLPVYWPWQASFPLLRGENIMLNQSSPWDVISTNKNPNAHNTLRPGPWLWSARPTERFDFGGAAFKLEIPK